MVNKPKAIIFDMNGVLVDDEPLHEEAFREVLQTYHLKLSHRDYAEYFLGRSDVAGFKRYIDRHAVSSSLDELVDEKMEQYWQLVKKGIPEVDGAREIINKLADSYILAISTGATQKELEAVLKQMAIKDFFAATITVEDFSKSKPDPEPYIMTAKALHADPRACMVLEDAPAGIQSAKVAGMRCIGLTTTHKKSELKEADYVVDSFDEVEDLLQ